MILISKSPHGTADERGWTQMKTNQTPRRRDAQRKEFLSIFFASLRLCVSHSLVAALVLITAFAGITDAQTASDSTEVTKSAGAEELALVEGRLADRYRRLEQVMLRLAELSATTDPRRAAVLRRVVTQSKKQDISVRFESIVKLLEDERLATASQNQTTLNAELRALLDVLLKENRSDRLESEQKRIRRYLKEVNRLIRRQKGVKARTEGGDDADRLGETQKNIADQTGKLAGEIAAGEAPAGGRSGSGSDESEEPDENQPSDDKKDSDDAQSSNEGDKQKGSEGQKGSGGQGQGQGQGQGRGQPGGEESPQGSQSQPSDTPQDRLRNAQQRMRQAQEKLRDAERSGAAEQQQKAIEALEQARAELEEILRQLREEQRERLLAMLEARFRKMLQIQVKIYGTTQQLDRVSLDRRDHDEEIEAGRLSRQEKSLVREADKAMRLLAADGTSVAFPEAVDQMREDMQQVAVRLARLQVGTTTQGIEEDIIAALKEMIEALQQAQKEQESRQGKPSQGQPTDPPLVERLAELKMIRLLQMRVNRRTERYSNMIEESQAQLLEILEALDRLAQREQRIFEATRDLETGKNQ